MPEERKIKVLCPKCKSQINYTKTNIRRTKDGLIKCRIDWCDYVFTRDETDKIEYYLMIE